MKMDSRVDGKGGRTDRDKAGPTGMERPPAVQDSDKMQKPPRAAAPAVKAPPPRTNGHIRAAKSESDGGWQKAGKGKKRPANIATQQGQAEQPPKNDSERKGG